MAAPLIVEVQPHIYVDEKYLEEMRKTANVLVIDISKGDKNA